MTVAQLIDELRKYPAEATVCVRARDADTEYYVGVEEAHELTFEDEIVYINGEGV